MPLYAPGTQVRWYPADHVAPAGEVWTITVYDDATGCYVITQDEHGIYNAAYPDELTPLEGD